MPFRYRLQKVLEFRIRKKEEQLNIVQKAQQAVYIAEENIRKNEEEIRTTKLNMRQADPMMYETYDKVLLDAPCSGLGVLGHKVELRWRRKESDLSVFPPLQKQLIEQAAKYTKTGGVLVYSTCTLNPDENEHIINEFLSLHSEFAPEEFNFPVLGKSLNGMMTLYPDLVRSDGFFVAKLRKVSHEA